MSRKNSANFSRIARLACFSLLAYPQLAQAKPKSQEDACATQLGIDPSSKKIPAGSKIVVYNFLDVRSVQYTPKVMTKIDDRITSCLSKHGFDSVIRRSQDLPFIRNNPMWLTLYSGALQSQNVPAEEMIASNLDDEAAQGAQYRLQFFPTEYIVTGSWRTYKIQWEFINVANQEVIFNHEYTGKHLALWSDSENSDAKSFKIVFGVFSELRKGGIL